MAFSQISPENSMIDLICILVLTHMHTQKHTPPTTHHRQRAYTLHVHTIFAHTMRIHTTHTEAPTAITLSPKFRVFSSDIYRGNGLYCATLSPVYALVLPLLPFSLTVCRLPLLLGPVVLQRETPWLFLCVTVCTYAREGECVCFSHTDSKCVLA